MFKKILVANRGEIACRIIRSAQQLGIDTVAVYSDADRAAMHVELADEAVHIGPAESAQSYLVIDNIIEACAQTQADAVHPGYGFLSENAAFTAALAKTGIAFIGPGSGAITRMGDKITSKLLAQQAGVNTIPGYTDTINDAEHAVTIAREIGYPVMLKATAGGGGKGMRVVWNDDECREGFERASNEARSSFGDERVFAEKFIEQPRHIEIQIIADNHGSVVYLGERECSVQRRHQKVIEEAPSPFIDEETRRAMGEQAANLARAVDYRSAGTVEFVVDQARNFYFLEMNTRLQVEHPVTELVTGYDLVELMIRIANDEPLPFTQKDVNLEGWAMEARVYAEDPLRNFMPSTGRLTTCIPPAENEHVRVDTGVKQGSEISIFYDPMIAKLITHGDTRDEAIEHMHNALDAYCIRGVNHNMRFLNALFAHPRFRAGELTTNFIADEYPQGISETKLGEFHPLLLLAIAGAVHRAHIDRASAISGQLPHHERIENSHFVVVVGSTHQTVDVTSVEGGFEVNAGDHIYRIVTKWSLGAAIMHAEVNGHPMSFQVARNGVRYRLSRRGAEIDALVLSARAAELSRHMIEKDPPDLSKFLLSPMPGLLVRLNVGVGDNLKAGEELAVVEAMKMENSLRADEDIVVARILAKEGDTLVVDQPIVEFG